MVILIHVQSEFMFFFLKMSFIVGLCFVAFKENCTHEHSIDRSCLLVNIIIDFHVDWVK